MRTTLFVLVTALLVASTVSAAEPKRYIVAFDPRTTVGTAEAQVLSELSSVIAQQLADEVEGLQVRGRLALINGLVIEADEAALAQVTTIAHEAATHRLPDLATFANSSQDDLEQVVIIEEDFPVYAYGEAPWGIDRVAAVQVWDKDKDGKLDNGAPVGKGVKVAVLDTGIDYRHPDLKANYRGGYDIINNDNDPLDDNGHGTHCAGTIAAVLDGKGVVGVAPMAELYGVKVLAGSGGGSSTSVIQGIEWAVANRMDIISMSLGSPWPSKAQEMALQKAYDAGILTIAASGNSGTGSLGYPAGYESVVAVGALDATNTLASFSQYGKGQELVAPGVEVYSPFPLGFGRKLEARILDEGPAVTDFGILAKSPLTPTEGVTGELVPAGLGKPEDFQACSGKIALIKRGELKFHEKVVNAQQAGCSGVVLFNNEPANFSGTLEDNPKVTIPAVSISGNDGAKILQHLQDKPVRINIKVLTDDYAQLNGTSMACPHVSGVAALVRSAFPKLTNAQVRKILTSTAANLGTQGYDEKYGHGLVNAAKAVQLAEEVLKDL